MGRLNRSNPAAAVYLRDFCAILQKVKSEDGAVKTKSREVLGGRWGGR